MKIASTFRVGFWAITRAAEKVSDGGGTPGEDANENNWPHGVPSPADPPAEFTHAARIDARVLSFTVGAISLEASSGPGAVPSLTLTSLPIVSSAEVNPCASEFDAPIASADAA